MPPLVTEEEVILSILPNMETSGAIEFKMDKKSYRMVPLANSEDYLYNKNSLDRAREVCFGIYMYKIYNTVQRGQIV